MRIVEESICQLEDYSSVPISFQIVSRMRLDDLGKGNLVEEEVEPRWKDYDAVPDERPSDWPSRFDLTNWGVLVAYEDERRVGGAIVARDTPGFDMLRGRTDLAVLADLRVHPDTRGAGVGKALFLASLDWARAHECVDLIVETQDTNVAACRFYSAMGCTLDSIDREGYGPDLAEAKLIWRIGLVG